MQKEQQQSKIRTKKKDNKRSGDKQKGQQKETGGNTKSIHDNPQGKENKKPMRQLSKEQVPNKQNSNNEVQVRDVQQDKW